MRPKKDEAFEQYRNLAEASLREALALDNDYLGHMLLAELLKENPQRLDEAEDHLNQAKALTANEDMLLTIEYGLGEIAMEQAQYQKALQHFHMVELYRLLLNINKTRQLPAVNKTRQLPGRHKTKQATGLKNMKKRATKE